MKESEYPNGHWKTCDNDIYYFLNDELMAVYGEVRLHKDIPPGHYDWYYSARVNLNARLKNENPIEGYAPSLNYAKKIVEIILHNTLTCKKY